VGNTAEVKPPAVQKFRGQVILCFEGGEAFGVNARRTFQNQAYNL
jgi:hypothetical protein